MSPDSAPLLDILLAIGDALGFVEGLSAKEFHADTSEQDGPYSARSS